MSQFFNLHPPALLFTNDGIYSPSPSHLDQYGVPDSINNPLLQLTYAANLIGFIGEGPLAATRPPEKRFLYGTFFDEIILWAETIKTRHNLDFTFEPWILPNGNLVQMPTQQGGTQFDGYTLHNPEFWKLWRRNIERLIKGKELDQSEIDTINASADLEFPDENNLLSQTGIFGRGKISPSIAPWVFPFDLIGNFQIKTHHYIYRSIDDTWANSGTASTAGNSGPDHVGCGYTKFYDVFFDEQVYLYGFTLFKMHTTHSEPKGKTLRQMYGDFALAINMSESAVTYPSPVNPIPNGGAGTFRVGLLWSADIEWPSWDGQPPPTVTWFNSSIADGLNVITIPDFVLDETAPNPNLVPYIIFGPSTFDDPPTANDTSYGLNHNPPTDVGSGSTGYAHNYPCRQHNNSTIYMRLCSNEVYMQW